MEENTNKVQVTWYDVVKLVGEFRNGKLEKIFVKESTLLEFYAP